MLYHRPMIDDAAHATPADPTWSDPALASRFVDDAYATVKGRVRTHVLHHQLLEHLPPAPAAVLDVGGGAGHQSFPLAAAGHNITVLDPSAAMLDQARTRLANLPAEAQARATLLQSAGEDAAAATAGRRFDAVLCHGVLGYLADPSPLIAQLCACTKPGGIVSIMTGNAATQAIAPALRRRWSDALAAFDAPTADIPGLGVRGRGDTVDGLGALLQAHGVETERWYGTWTFVDWLAFGGTPLDDADDAEVAAIAAVELEASQRDPYRQVSRAFHLIGRKTARD